MHTENCFVTLTYSDEHLESPRLQYRDFQLFMKRLRFAYPNRQIGVFVTGEYGDRTKRPHWHACIFDWSPPDATFKYSNERGDQAFESSVLSRLWGKGIAEFGQVTFHSAGYCARYAAKKLCHGHDGAHEFEPISKKSSRNAIGKKWLERHWRDLLRAGAVVLPDGTRCGIPRYYVKWLLRHQPGAYFDYLLESNERKVRRAIDRETRDRELRGTSRISKHDARREIQKQKFDYLQSKLKL